MVAAGAFCSAPAQETKARRAPIADLASISSGGSELPVPAVDSDEGFVFMPIGGVSMEIRTDPTQLSRHTVSFTEGVSAADKKNPDRIVFYPYPLIRLVPNPNSLPGQPNVVWKAVSYESKVKTTMRFRRFSEKDRRAGEATIERYHRTYLDQERQRRERPELKPTVNKAPIIDLFIAIKNGLNGLTLACARQNVRSAGDEIDMDFIFDPEAYKQFLEAWKLKEIKFKPVYRASGKVFEQGVRRTQASVDVGLIVSQELSSEQLLGTMPIFQGDADRISRRVAVAVNEEGNLDGLAVLNLIKSDNLLLASVFEPATWMSLEDFQKTFGPEAQQILALYLEPYEITRFEDKTDTNLDGKQNGHETTSSSGSGWGFPLPFFGFAKSSEDHTRDLEMIAKLTGVQFRKGRSERTFAPHRIKVYKLAQGYEKKHLEQANTIAIGVKSTNHYLADTEFDQDFTTTLVDAALDAIIEDCAVPKDLRSVKSQKETELAALMAKVAPALAEQKRLLESIASLPSELPGHADTVPPSISESVREEWMRGIYGMIKAVWGWEPPGGKDGQTEIHMTSTDDDPNHQITRRQRSQAAKQAITDSLNAIRNKASVLADALSRIAAQQQALAAAWPEIERLTGEIDELNRRIASSLDR